MSFSIQHTAWYIFTIYRKNNKYKRHFLCYWRHKTYAWLQNQLFSLQLSIFSIKIVSSQDNRTNKEYLNNMTRFKHIFIMLFALGYSICINAQESNVITHTVDKGQTLYSISKLYNTTVEEIVKMNPESEKTLSVGQQLRIPRKTNNENKVLVQKNNDGTIYHTIQSGIWSRHCSFVQELCSHD